MRVMREQRKVPLWKWCFGFLINYILIALAYLNFYGRFYILNTIDADDAIVSLLLILMGFLLSQLIMGCVICTSDMNGSRKIALAISSVLFAVLNNCVFATPIHDQLMGI